MSKTIDSKVVEMQFDNKNFEKNVETSMSTLDKLKQKLNLTGASKGLENIDASSKKVNFSGLSNALSSVSSGFSSLEVMGITALANITNSAVNAGKRIVSALTIDPIKTGFSEYETQIGAVQTILANTSSKGTDLEDVNSALDQLNAYADKTIYNFTEMTRNIGTFTAAGVDLDTSVKSIQGIANLAAVSGSTSQQASTAMYQLSQALAAGKVQLMDWNSVVNAGMGGQVFQDALKRTAKNMGKDVDGMIAKYGSFRESLSKGEWLTSDVLTKTLEQFTMAAEEGTETWEKYKQSLMSEGYTEQQAQEILKMANTATDAATKVKTFTQLWDTVKEAAQSGWTQTWEILVGDFEEAKELLTGVSNVLNDFINKSAASRNELLQGWKDAGGRATVIEALKNAFEGISNIIGPVSEAFGEIFPPLTTQQLLKFSDKLKELTGRFAEFTKKHGPQIKSTFKGIFAVLDIGVTIIKSIVGGIFKLTGSILGLTGGILSGTASFGDWLSNMRDSVKESNIFGKAINGIVGFLQKGIDKLKEFGASLRNSFKQSGYSGFVGFLKAIWDLIVKIGSAIGKAFGGIGQAIANTMGENSFGDVLNSGIFTVFLAGLMKFISNLNKPLDSMSDMLDKIGGKNGILANVVGILDDVRGCFQAYQQQLKAGTLLKIAGAIGILAASIWVISTIDPTQMAWSLGMITMLFAELIGALAIINKLTMQMKGFAKVSTVMLSLSTSLLILALAMKAIGSLEPERMVSGLIGIAGGIAALVIALRSLPKQREFKKATKAIRSMSISLLILAGALKIMGSMNIAQMGIALLGMVGGLGAMIAALHLMPKKGQAQKAAQAMLTMSVALLVLAQALKTMGSMSWMEIAKSLVAMVGGLGLLIAALHLMPKNMGTMGISLIAVATAILILAQALKTMGSMSWEEIGKGLTLLGGVLLELSLALLLMKSSIGGAAALLVAALALTVLMVPLKLLGSMSWESIVKCLVGLAGAFVVIGVAGAVLTPVIPMILLLAASFALLGVGMVGIGAGLALIGTGISILAASLAAGATAIVAGITVIIAGLLDLVPMIILKIGEAIVALCKVIGDSAPQIADAILKLIYELVKSFATYTPLIASALFDLLIGVLNVIAERLPELIKAAVNVIGAFLQGVIDALKSVDTKTLTNGLLAVGILAALMAVLASMVVLAPLALAGTIGMGLVIAELALVLAAIGKLAQIPGLSYLIGEGGNLLEKIGTAIGQFIGGLIGGLAQGITNSLPDIASDLSDFMTNIQTFIEGARSIDGSILSGIASLVSAILLITGASVVSSIASFLTGGSSLDDFGAKLVPFGKSLKEYGDAVAGVDTKAITESANAAKALALMAEAVPNSGGLAGLFAGENNLADFATQLVPFGVGLRGFSLVVAGIDTNAITQAANAAKAIAEMADTIPNSGGVASWFAGDNSIASFSGELVSLGEGIKGFSDAIVDVVPENIVAAANAAKAIAEMMDTIPNEGGMVAWFTGDNSVANFSSELKTLGTGIKDFSTEIDGIVPENITAAASAAKSLAEMMSVIPNEGGMVAWFTGDNSVATFASNLKPLGTGLKDFAAEVAGIVPENVVAAANAAKAIAEMADIIPNEGGVASWFAGENSVSKFASNLKPLGTGLKDFASEVAGIVPENVIAAANAAKALAEMFSIIPNEGGIKAWFTGKSAISTFSDKLPSLGKGIKGFSDEVAEIVPENVTAAANAAKAIADMASTAPKDTEKFQSFGDALASFGAKLKLYFERISGITTDTINISTAAINSITSTVANLNPAVLTTASEAIDKFVESVKKISEISQDSVQGFTDAMKKLGESNVNTLIDTFNAAAPNLEEAGKKAITTLSEGIKKEEATMKTAGSEAVKKLADGLKSEKFTLSTACKTIVNDCMDALKGYKHSFYEIGADLVDGFANGISMNSYKAAVKAQLMGQRALKAAKEELGIHSPSKEFYKIGSFVTQGFIKALTDGGSDVYKASGSMADSATKGMSSAISRITDLMNNDISNQPVIKPILDLSDIQAGSSAINGMFGDVGVGANLNAISTGMNLRNQNGGNEDLISAINKLGRSLSSVPRGDTYNVNGVTYDDGSNVSNAVKEIIRAAKVERRV